MKVTLFFLLVFISTFHAFSQCSIITYIENNYIFDAKLLALRDILANPNDPNYDNPFLPDEPVTKYLERLSALYENPNNDPEVDLLFNFFKFHVNVEYTANAVAFKKMFFGVNNDEPWLEDFKNTGISGVVELDNLMSTYQLSVTSFVVLNSVGITYFDLETSFSFLNINALIDDFDAIPTINGSGGIVDGMGRFNYTGQYYLLNGHPVELCDIIAQGETFTFALGADDCFSGCQEMEYRFATVTEDCRVLSTSNFNKSEVKIYPNPTSEILNIDGLASEKYSVSIYSIEGRLMKKMTDNANEIDVSFLKSGVYFVEIKTESNEIVTKKFIKQ